MNCQTLLPDPNCLHLLHLEADATTITIVVTAVAEETACSKCGQYSSKIHSQYVRMPADLPWMSCAVRLRLHCRRFFCSNAQYEQQIFVERLPSVIAPSARRTLRLADLLAHVGFALGGEAGRKLAEKMGTATSPDTFLRQICASASEEVPTPKVLGVDDFGATRSYRCSREDSRKEARTWGSAPSASTWAESSAPGIM